MAFNVSSAENPEQLQLRLEEMISTKGSGNQDASSIRRAGKYLLFSAKLMAEFHKAGLAALVWSGHRLSRNSQHWPLRVSD